MQFPQRDLTNQYISTSYQDVVQRFFTGSTDYLLDGLGYTILGIPAASIGGIVLTQDQTASYSNFADTASYAYTSSFELMTEVSSSWASESYHSKIADGAITSSYSLFSAMSDTASMSILSEFSDTASFSLYAHSSDTSSFITASNVIGTVTSSSYSLTASYSISSSWSPAKYHVESGIISGSDFIGSPKYFDVVYVNPYSNNIYTISVIGDDVRVWSTNNRSSSGFTINSNSNQPLIGMVMWRVEEII